MSELISKDAVVNVLKSGIPDAEWLLGQIESKQGWFRFPPYITNCIVNLKIENYPILYLNENSIGIMMFKGFFSDEEIRELDAEIINASPQERAEFLAGLAAELDRAVEGFEIPKTPAAQAKAQQKFDALSPDEQKESIRFSQHFFSSLLPSFYQLLSIMVHGEKLTSLVEQARAGNDDAFVKAVQIDRRILTVIPYFRDRYARAQDEADSNFYDYLSYRLKTAPYKGKIRHKTLWLAFAILDQAGLLDDMPHSEILAICDQAGVGGYDNRIQSVKHLSGRLREYREFQKRGFIATT